MLFILYFTSKRWLNFEYSLGLNTFFGMAFTIAIFTQFPNYPLCVKGLTTANPNTRISTSLNSQWVNNVWRLSTHLAGRPKYICVCVGWVHGRCVWAMLLVDFGAMRFVADDEWYCMLMTSSSGDTRKAAFFKRTSKRWREMLHKIDVKVDTCFKSFVFIMVLGDWLTFSLLFIFFCVI